MPQTIKNEAGEDVEVFTKEELEAKATEQTEAKLTEERARLEEEKQVEITAKEEELADANEKLKKLQDKEHNFNVVARGSKKKEEEEQATTKRIEELEGQIKGLISQPIAEARESFVSSNLAEADKDTKEKFDFYYNKLSVGVKSKAEAEKAMKEAFSLASPGKTINNGAKMQQTGVNDDFAAAGTEQESEASKEFGEKMGVSADDKKKYQPGKVNLLKPNVGVKKGS